MRQPCPFVSMAAVLAGFCVGCVGAIADGALDAPEPPGPEAVAVTPKGPQPSATAAAAAVAGRELAAVTRLRRLTVTEYDNVLRDLLLDGSRPAGAVLPEGRDPFDNDLYAQEPSKALVQGTELLAQEAAARLMLDPPRRDKVVGCRPARADDQACFAQFVATFGRRALRRPLPDAELQRYGKLLALAAADGNFYSAIDAAVRVFLQHPEFLYRVEIGTPVPGAPGLFRLGPYEVAARLSFLLAATTPDDALLVRAQAGRLETAADLTAAATELMARTAARDQITRFHALWMGFEQLPHPPALARPLQAETAALVARVVFQDRRPWQDLLRSDETFVPDMLVKHYGLPAPAAPSSNARWVPYGASGRRGLLSHGSFLSLGNKFDDTSPTVRGKEIRERLFCDVIPPPPPEVNSDLPPADTPASACKWDRYAAHREGGCAGCHGQMDPIGFGLENYDAAGRYRTREAQQPQCLIEGKGELPDVGTFSGPAELAGLMLGTGRLNRCVATQFYRFATGRPLANEDDIDRKAVAALAQAIGNGDFRFDELVVGFVSAPAFAHRHEED
jgi:hypothetical protein